MAIRYRVTLTDEERCKLESMCKTGKTNARKFMAARTLLLCDHASDSTPWSTVGIATALGISSRTVEHVKKRFVEEGFEAVLERKKREKPPRGIVFDGAFEARLITLACSKTPEGHSRWTVRLLADKAVELGYAQSVSHMTVHRILKKRT
jgi:transposase